MSIENKLNPQDQPAGQEDQSQDGTVADLSDEEQKDLKIAALLGEHALDAGGLDVIQKAVQSSKDPGQVIGQFLLQLGQKIHESMPDNIQLSPKIFLCEGGWVEQMSDYIQKEDGVKKDIMDKAEIYVASTASQMAQAKQQQGQGSVDGVQAPPAPAPTAPQAPMPSSPDPQPPASPGGY